MNAQELKALTAICGIDCFNCEFFHTNIDGFFASITPERKAAFDARGMTIEKLRCNGCRNGGCTTIGGKCDTLECVKQHDVDFCFECPDFPCQRLQPLAEGADRYPHNLKVYNLTRIMSKGIVAWAAEVGTIRKAYFRGKFKIGAGPQLPPEE